MAKENSELAVVRVEKKRYGFSVEGIICEYAQVWFNGAMVETACCESENYEGMKKATQALGISELPNTNYLKAANKFSAWTKDFIGINWNGGLNGRRKNYDNKHRPNQLRPAGSKQLLSKSTPKEKAHQNRSTF